ncbi:MAG: hypothetical protein IGQ45_02230 [Cyanobacterium sp. T60_A2020_053]|nr:hypothetical protein [Cyanobacterium sp. T60_A2020_053]
MALLKIKYFLFLLLSLITVINENISSVQANEIEEEKLFQIKANLVIDQLAETTKIPSEGDVEKYAFPIITARLEKNIDLDWSAKQLQRLTQRPPDSFYLKGSFPIFTRINKE